MNYYLEIAAKNNPKVMQRFNEYQAALQKVPQVSSLPDPQLEMGVFLSPMELIGGSQVADIKLMQMFPWFGVIKNAKDEMSLMAKAKYEAFIDAKLQVFYEVQSIWFDLYKVRRNLAISEGNMELLKSIERLSIGKFKSGSTNNASSSGSSKMSGIGIASSSGSGGGMSGSMNGISAGSNASAISSNKGVSVPKNSSMSSGSSSLADVYRIQIEISDLENSIALLKNEEQIIRARFNSQLNRSLTLPVSVSDSLSVEPLAISYLSVSDSMFIQHPMLTMLKYDQQSIGARKKMQKQMGLPMIGVGLNYSVIAKNSMSTSHMNGDDMIMPMLSISLPIYRKKYSSIQTESTYLKTALENNYQATVNALKTEYYEALQLYFDAQRRMRLYQNQSQLTRKSFDILLKSYAASATGLTEIVQLQQQLLDYEMRQEAAKTDFNKSKAWIERLNATLR
ncbi:MAG: TolC family protein [Paludibacter sp.]|nr:TolC family protein [Paludibacter sp.]